MTPSSEGLHVDPCNLFIKNLDPNIFSSDLFNYFRQYGHIISARIMRDQETGNSKGFGFVSYTTAKEADRARCSMHGKTLGTKQIIIRLHEPKKLYKGKLANHFSGSPIFSSDNYPPSRCNSDYFNLNTVNDNNNQSDPMAPCPEGPYVDPCNLFIKNLDSNISSIDLFNHFRQYGHIISARIIRDQETGISKGFGFVSYTTAKEADKAKSSMHGKTIGTKQIIVRLHEPKKLHEAKLANNFSGNTTFPSDSPPSSDFFNINTVNEFAQDNLSGQTSKACNEGLMSKFLLLKDFKNIPNIPQDEINPFIENWLHEKVSGVTQMLQHPLFLSQGIANAANTLTTSIINNNITNNNNGNNNYQQVPQREKFLNAINKINFSSNSAEILDLLMTLSPQKRSLCYFNAEYLNKKIAKANGALEAVNIDDKTAASNPKSMISVDLEVSNSEVPIVVSSGAEFKEIEEFMDDLKNKPVHKQKQKLGDRLFPQVKKLGLKNATASKVTINLLETHDLHELAHSMYDREKLEQKVSATAQKVQAATNTK